MVVNPLQYLLRNYIGYIPTPVCKYMVEGEILVMVRDASALCVALITGGGGTPKRGSWYREDCAPK